MNIYKLEDSRKIYEDQTISRIIGYAMFNPTYGRIKSAAESIYSKEQGRFYICETDDVVGIVGVRRVDNAFVEIMHIAVDENHRKQGIASALVKYVRDAERVDEIIAHTDTDAVGFYEKLGFRIEEEEDKMTGLVRFTCRLEG